MFAHINSIPFKYYPKIIKNIFAIINPTMPHPGKVHIQVKIKSFTTDQLTFFNLFAAPTPIIDVVFVWVVLTGMPVREEISRQVVAEKSAANPWYGFNLTISIPTDLIIRYPPMEVPSPIIKEHKTISHIGTTKVPVPVSLLQNATLKRKIAMNF